MDSISKASCDVLVVEDDEDVRDALAVALRGEGLSVLEAATGAMALSLLRIGHAPQAMVLDLVMPDMTGDAVVQAIREDPSLPLPAIVVATGRDMPGRPLPVVAVMRKPFQAADLMRVLWPVVRGQQYVPRQ